jgi:hypothetical protein
VAKCLQRAYEERGLEGCQSGLLGLVTGVERLFSDVPRGKRRSVLMVRNCGTTDRVTRLVIAAVLGFFVATQLVEGWFAIVLGVIAALLAVSALLGVCPLYRLLDLDSQPTVEADDNPFAIHH